MRRALASSPLGPGLQIVCDAAQGTSVTVATDPNGVSATIGPDGGVLVAEGSDGTRYTMTFPEEAIVLPGGLRVTMTPITSIVDLPTSGAFLGGVILEPDGLTLLQPAQLAMRLTATVDPNDVLGFNFKGAGEGLYFVPSFGLESGFTRITLPVSHFTGIGSGIGVQSDIDATPPRKCRSTAISFRTTCSWYCRLN